MPREGAEAKGRRYLAEGRLVVHLVANGTVEATCRGDGSVYELGFERGAWWCECPARGVCSHLVALRLVVATRGGPVRPT